MVVVDVEEELLGTAGGERGVSSSLMLLLLSLSVAESLRTMLERKVFSFAREDLRRPWFVVLVAAVVVSSLAAAAAAAVAVMSSLGRSFSFSLSSSTTSSTSSLAGSRVSDPESRRWPLLSTFTPLRGPKSRLDRLKENRGILGLLQFGSSPSSVLVRVDGLLSQNRLGRRLRLMLLPDDSVLVLDLDLRGVVEGLLGAAVLQQRTSVYGSRSLVDNRPSCSEAPGK